MSYLRAIRDGLVGVASRLGTSSDKAEATSYYPRLLTDTELYDAFRSSWIIKKTVRVPSLDATRKWRQWRGDDAAEIAKVEQLPRVQVRKKTHDALMMSRIYGGAILLIGTDASDYARPVDVSREKLQFLTAMSRMSVSCGEIENDATSELYGLPSSYSVVTRSGIMNIHPSRVVRFVGEPLPSFSHSQGVIPGWGDSVLQSIYDACRNLDSTMGNIAALVFDAKTDIVKIPGLTESITSEAFETALVERFSAARMLKGNHGTLILDGEEEYDSKTYNFGGLDTIADRFMQVASGAADIPMTRLLGMSPAGMNSTGESDLLNYYDRISSMQHTEIAPEMRILDDLIVRTAGLDPEGQTYVWGSLRQLTDQQRSEGRKRAAETLKTLADTQVYDDDQLAKIGADLFRDLEVDVPDEPGDVPDELPVMMAPQQTVPARTEGDVS